MVRRVLRTACLLAIALLMAPLNGQSQPASAEQATEVLFLRMPDEPPIAAEDFTADRVREFLGQHPEVVNSYQELLRPDRVEFARQVLGQEAFFEEIRQCEAALGVRIRVQFIPWGEAFALFREMGIAEPHRAMVAQLGDTWAAFVADLGLIAGTPRRYTWDARFFWYRRDLFSESDFATGAAFRSACQRVAKAKPEGLVAPFAIPSAAEWDLLHVMATLEYAAGADSLVAYERWPWPHYRTDLSGEAGRIATDWLTALQRDGTLDLADRTNVQVTQEFLAGKYGCIIAPPWVESWAKQASRSYLVSPDQIGAAWPPALGNRLGGTFLGGSLLATVAPKGTPPETVREEQAVVDYFCSPESQQRYVRKLGFIPADPASSDRSQLDQLFQRAVQDGVRYPQEPSWPLVVENLIVRDQLYVFARRLAVLYRSPLEAEAGSEERKGLIWAALASADKDSDQRSRQIGWAVWWPFVLGLPVLAAVLACWRLLAWKHRRDLDRLERQRAELEKQLTLHGLQRAVDVSQLPPRWLADMAEQDERRVPGEEAT